MKKILPVILFLATITLSACGTPKTDDGKTVNNEKVEEKTESKKSLKELLALGTAQKCTYEVNEDGSKMKGEIIVKGEKFKQSMEITTDQGKMMVYALSDGTYYYSWGDAMGDQGTKMKIDELQSDAKEVEKENPGTQQQKIDWEEKFDYKCVAATLNDSDLALPTDIKFVDYTETLKSLQQGNLDDLKKLIPSGTEE